VLDRAKELKKQIPDTLKELVDRNMADAVSNVPVFNISSVLYMQWVENSEFLF
jgi:hypothetical protein